MNIEKDRVVSIDYELKDSEGKIIDRSEGDPLTYLHGNDNLIPGLERELEGKKAGDSLSVTVAPADGYGERDDELIFAVSKSDFAEPDKIEVGMQFQAHQEGSVNIVTVVGVTDDEVKVDANHPLAGKTLHFDVNVKEVREASAEELEHGHVHAASGCDCGEGCGDDCECGDGCGDDEGCGCGGGGCN
ncbi:MAG: peptidylprolyl isomerase [Clostridia bacterium]|jgi:FKBP-type peptidyl-prolyl cis-trans isomerase SlyD|nr:peptidylprolyl isomerase [Spirochaetia bacterium]